MLSFLAFFYNLDSTRYIAGNCSVALRNRNAGKRAHRRLAVHITTTVSRLYMHTLAHLGKFNDIGTYEEKKYKHTYEYIKRGPFTNELPGGPNVILPIHEKCASAQVKAWICSRKIMQRNLMEKKRGYLQADLFRLSVMHCSVFHSVRPTN